MRVGVTWQSSSETTQTSRQGSAWGGGKYSIMPRPASTSYSYNSVLVLNPESTEISSFHIQNSWVSPLPTLFHHLR